MHTVQVLPPVYMCLRFCDAIFVNRDYRIGEKELLKFLQFVLNWLCYLFLVCSTKIMAS